jgi:lysozyme family protein
MKQNEDRVIKLVLESEGGYSNDAGDPGGPTMYGITIWDVRKYVKPDADANDVRRLTVDQAIEIYDKHYWDPSSGDDQPSGLDYTVVDYGVNSGIGRPPRVASALLGIDPPASTWRPDLIKAVRAADPQKLVDAMCDERLHFMHQIRGGDAWSRFGHGWGTRVSSVRQVSKNLADGRAISPSKTIPAGKATHVDPKLGEKTTIGAATATATTGTAAHSGVHHYGITFVVVIATVALCVLVGYLIGRQQQRRQDTVVLPPGAPKPSDLLPTINQSGVKPSIREYE